ncbi:MAG: hypothetical protein Q4A66_00555 [Eubacteriales bacterium]|nr:hypothetical protein [Eubacteriales bacterium]
MSTVAYNCPCCGAPLAYGAQSGKLECASCGNSYELEAIEAMQAPQSAGGVQFELPTEGFGAADAQSMQAFVCESCGAELMTENTTTATQCPYCGSPTVLPGRIEGGVKPEKVIPFKVTKEQAQKQFDEYFQGKLLLPNIFKNSRNRISEMRRLYVPYWLFDCDAEANIVYDAEKKEKETRGDWEIETTEHYIVRRAGSMRFENIPVDGSEKLDNEITESLEPYDLSEAVPFQPAVLAGSMADHADVNEGECEGRAVERVEYSIEQAIRSTVRGYSSVTERSKHIHAQGGKVTPVLMPVWLITTEKEGKTYTFAINGQTGKLTCDVPADKTKSFLWGGGVFAVVLAIAALVLHLTQNLASGTLLMAAVAAFIAAFVTVVVLTGQLKQATSQTSAEEYTVKDSFQLHVEYDRFLYRTTERRKIEKKEEEQK